MSTTCEDEPAPKRMKTSQEGVTSDWAHLPSVVLTEVFKMLNKEDRRNASAVCKNWRRNCFQRRWWNSMTFSIQPDEFEKARFLTNTFGMMVSYAGIVLKSVSAECLKELINLLRNLARNANLQDLVIKYSPGDCELLHNFTNAEERSDGDLEEVANLLNMCLPKLRGFTAACMGALSLSVGTILKNLNPTLLRRLELTAMASSSEKNHLDQALFKLLTKLEKLIIDQQSITDELMDVVESCTALKEVIVYHRAYFRNVDPPEKSENFYHAVRKIPSRRLMNVSKFHCECCRIHNGKSWQEIIVKRVLLL